MVKMQRAALRITVLLVFLGLAAGMSSAEDVAVLKTQKDQVNYAIGVNIINTIKQQGLEIDLDFVVKGMRDASGGGKLLLGDDELRKAISQYQTAAREKQAQRMAKVADENKKAGEAFLAENAKKDGVVTLPSGLQYKVLKTGNGKKPTDADTVECNYRGTLITGAEFDSSARSGKPIAFKVSSVIPGWTEALKLMPAGSAWQLFVPANLAYGERGAGGMIGPNTTLIFDVELLAIK